MSNAVLPDLPGLDIAVRKTPIWKTQVQTAVSGKELRNKLFSYPLYQITVSFNVLRAGAEAELQTLIGFFNSRNGSFDNFLYADPMDFTVTDQSFGAGNGAATQFQLVRTLGGHVEPVMNLNGNPVIKVAGVTKTLTTDYTIDATGMVTFVTAPANGAALTWSGNYYYRVRFENDEAEFEQFLWHLWQAKKIELYGSIGVKV